MDGFYYGNEVGEVEWDTLGYTVGMGRFDSIVNTDTFVTLPGLMANTDYEYNVRAICGAGDTSSWAGNEFTTPCNAFAAPYTESFDSDSQTEDCWKIINANNDNDEFNLNATNDPFEGDQGLYLYTWNNGDNDDYAITPPLTVDGDQQLRYYTRSQSATSTDNFYVLVSTTGSEIANFTDTLYRDTIMNDEYEERIVSLDAYTSGDIYVAFHVNGENTLARNLFLDEITFEKIPTCFRVLDLDVDSTTAISASISWSDTSSASQWMVEWDTAGYAVGNGRFDSLVLTDTFVTMPNLMSNTVYNYNVRAVCAVGDTSSIVSGSVRTQCTARAVPYTETANTSSATVSCWTWEDVNDDGFTWEVRPFTTQEGDWNFLH